MKKPQPRSCGLRVVINCCDKNTKNVEIVSVFSPCRPEITALRENNSAFISVVSNSAADSYVDTVGHYYHAGGTGSSR